MLTFRLTEKRNKIFFIEIVSNTKLSKNRTAIFLRLFRTDKKRHNGGKTSRNFNSFSCTVDLDINEMKNTPSKPEEHPDCIFFIILVRS